MKKLLFLFGLLICPLFGRSQVPVFQNVIFVSSAPSGACTNGSPAQIVISTGVIYTCQGSTWAVAGGGSGGGPYLPLAGGALTGPLNGTTANFSAGINATSDGVHAGYDSLVGNTANSAVVSNTAGFMGPSSASFTAYALQLSSTNPAANQIVTVGAPVSGVAPLGYETFQVLPPYFQIGANYYLGSGYQATKPPSSPSFINSVNPTVTAGTNGTLTISGAGQYWETQTATTSVVGQVALQTFMTSGNPQGGVWLYDSTNGKIYAWGFLQPGVTSEAPYLQLYTYTCTAPCTSTNPAFGTNPFNAPITGSFPLLKISVASTTMSFAVSYDGGGAWITFPTTESVGTITQGGYFMGNGSGAGSAMTVSSIAVN